jgi:hypothetical protein
MDWCHCCLTEMVRSVEELTCVGCETSFEHKFHSLGLRLLAFLVRAITQMVSHWLLIVEVPCLLPGQLQWHLRWTGDTVTSISFRPWVFRCHYYSSLSTSHAECMLPYKGSTSNQSVSILSMQICFNIFRYFLSLQVLYIMKFHFYMYMYGNFCHEWILIKFCTGTFNRSSQEADIFCWLARIAVSVMTCVILKKTFSPD